MVGQSKLLNLLCSYTIETSPRAIMIVGEEGSGKHTIVSEFSKHLGLTVIDITDQLSFDYINELQTVGVPSIYLINLSSLTEKKQNVVLKLLEESVSGSIIIALTNSLVSVLNTVINRCVVLNMEPYTKDELSKFITDEDNKDLLLKLVSVPGQFSGINKALIPDMLKLCDTILSSMSKARFSNALSIVTKLNFADSFDKFDIKLFLSALLLTLSNDYINNNNLLSLKMYNIVNSYRNKMLNDVRLNKEMLMENMITELWKVSRDEC